MRSKLSSFVVFSLNNLTAKLGKQEFTKVKYFTNVILQTNKNARQLQPHQGAVL